MRPFPHPISRNIMPIMLAVLLLQLLLSSMSVIMPVSLITDINIIRNRDSLSMAQLLVQAVTMLMALMTTTAAAAQHLLRRHTKMPPVDRRLSTPRAKVCRSDMLRTSTMAMIALTAM